MSKSKAKEKSTEQSPGRELRETTKANSGGAYQNIPILTDQGLRLSALNPKYLHTNSTSHTWPFSAIAELIDNAYDPDVDASQLWIDLKTFDGNLALTFTDNGNGMAPDKLYKMLSFGFCEKVAVNDHLPVGHYGNGFKSGSMRLGRDALVFTKRPHVWSLGFLSQTYLEKINADTIIVPIVTWDPKKFVLKNANDGGRIAFRAIMEHSVVKSVSKVREEFRCIPGQTGTRIVIFNLRKTSDKKSEFDFSSDISDIQIPNDSRDSEELKYKREQRQDHIPACDYSLRAYCSILYLKPKMQIILRGQKVKTVVIAKSLSKTEIDVYKPTSVENNPKPVKLVFGFSQNKNHYGIMMYHRNRLIKPYVRVGHQMKANNLGIGVVGVIECDFLQPTHNKQDFDYTKAYRACMAGLGRKLNEYWQEKKGHYRRTQQQQQQPVPDVPEELEKVPDELWVQCDNPKCLKWRKLPDNIKSEDLPDKWFCKDHPNPDMRSCDIPEEPYWEEEQELVPYKKEVKKQIEKERQFKKIEEQKTLSDVKAKYNKELEEERKKRLASEAAIKKKEEELKNLKQSLNNLGSSPSPSQSASKVTQLARPVVISDTSPTKSVVYKVQSTSPYSTRQQTNTPIKVRLPFNTKTAALAPKPTLVPKQSYSLSTTPSRIGALTQNAAISAAVSVAKTLTPPTINPEALKLIATPIRQNTPISPTSLIAPVQLKTVTLPKSTTTNDPAAVARMLNALTRQVATVPASPGSLRSATTGLVTRPLTAATTVVRQTNPQVLLRTVLAGAKAPGSAAATSPVVTLSLPVRTVQKPTVQIPVRTVVPTSLPATTVVSQNQALVSELTKLALNQVVTLQKQIPATVTQQSVSRVVASQVTTQQKQPSTSTMTRTVLFLPTSPTTSLQKPSHSLQSGLKEVASASNQVPEQQIHQQLAQIGIEAITGKTVSTSATTGKEVSSDVKPSIIQPLSQDSVRSLPTMLTTVEALKTTSVVSAALPTMVTTMAQLKTSSVVTTWAPSMVTTMALLSATSVGKTSHATTTTTTVATVKTTSAVKAVSSATKVATGSSSSVSQNGVKEADTLKRPLEILSSDDDDVEIIATKAPKRLRSQDKNTAVDNVKAESVPRATADSVKAEPVAALAVKDFVSTSKDSGKAAKGLKKPEKEIVIPTDVLENTSQVIIDDIISHNKESLVKSFALRCQQLMNLRASVCKLLGVLVPDLSLPEVQDNMLDDDTIDQLLKEVLEANKEEVSKS